MTKSGSKTEIPSRSEAKFWHDEVCRCLRRKPGELRFTRKEFQAIFGDIYLAGVDGEFTAGSNRPMEFFLSRKFFTKTRKKQTPLKLIKKYSRVERASIYDAPPTKLLSCVHRLYWLKFAAMILSGEYRAMRKRGISGAEIMRRFRERFSEKGVPFLPHLQRDTLIADLQKPAELALILLTEEISKTVKIDLTPDSLRAELTPSGSERASKPKWMTFLESHHQNCPILPHCTCQSETGE